MESVHKSGAGSAPGEGAGAGGEGVLCHACGYQFPNAHPSAKQRRAHRKHCGKPTSAAAAEEEGAGERDGSESLLGEGGGGGAGERIRASAAECGGGSPGSALEAGNAVEEGDNAEQSSGNGTGHQVIKDKCAEDCLVSCSNIPSEMSPEASRIDNDDTLTTVATQYSEEGSPIGDGDPAASSEQLQDIPASVPPPETEDGSRFGSVISEYEIQASNATGGGTSEQTNDVVRQLDGIPVTGEDGMIGKGKSSEDKSANGVEFGLSCQDDLQATFGEEHSTTVVGEDSSDKNLNAFHNEEIQNEATESNQQSKFLNIEEPVECFAVKSVGTADDLLSTGGCYLETPNIVKPQQRPDCTSEAADNLAIPKEADNVAGQRYPITEGGIQAISSAIGPADGAKVISVGDAANITENICSSDVIMEDSLQENVTSGTVVPSQVDLVELSASTTAHEINMVGSTNDVDEKKQNEKIGTDHTSHEINEMHIIEDFEEKQQNKEIVADPIPHETDAVSSTDNHRKNEQNEETIAETSSSMIAAVQCMSSIEEKEQIEQFIANITSEEINVASSGDVVEEKQHGETDAKTTREIDGAYSIETTGENNATCEINVGTTADYVEDKMQNEEVGTGPITHGINMICSSINEEKHNEGMIEDLSSQETIVVHCTDNVEVKTYEETTTAPTSHKFSLVTSTDNVEERKDEETNAEPTSHEINAAQTIDNVDEKNGEPILDPTSSDVGTVGSKGDVEDKKHSEETTADPGPGENNTLQGTDDAENKTQNGDSTTGPASDITTEVALNTNVVEEREKTGDTASKEISTIESATDQKGTTDQNEEIADKEMVTNSDRNHVSLKVLLADKNVETKEKKVSTKERVLSFRRRASKDNVSPVKPGSPKAGSGQQDWNSPARLPVEKKPKGRKQQWVPFICCSSIQ